MKISIIIPTYNREKDIRRCLDSVIGQITEGIEIVLIDDGSSDNTVSTIKKDYQYPFLNFIDLGKNYGVNYARNRGIEQAKGKYLLFLDSDDFLSDNALDTVNQTLQEHSSNYSHFLLTVSGRVDDSSLPSEKVDYVSWLTNEVGGDFCHVIEKRYFDTFKFFENFKAFPILNWLRILKLSSPQLFTNKVVVTRDRNRDDSIGATMLLVNKARINTQYRANEKLIEIYKDEFLKFAPDRMQELVFKDILLGVALGEYDASKKAVETFWKPKNIIIKTVIFLIVNLKLGLLVRGVLITKARLRQIISYRH